MFIGLFTGNWSQLWSGVKEIFSGIWDGITGLLDTALNLMKSLAEVVFGWFGTTWESVWTGIKTIFETIWNSIVAFFSGIWDGIMDAVRRLTHTMSYGLMIFGLGLCAMLVYLLMY